MKKIVLIILIAVRVLAVQAQVTDEQKYLLSIEKQRTDAIAAHDAAFLNNLFDDGFWGVTSSGSIIHKLEQLDLYKDLDAHVVFSNEQVQATVYGNAAVITGIQVTKSKTGSTLGKRRYLIVYSKLSDKWKIVMKQETEVIKK